MKLTRATVKAYFNLRIPVIVAPMFLVSGPDLVIESSNGGCLGTFPSLNCRSVDQLNTWISTIQSRLTGNSKFGINLVVQESKPQFKGHLRTIVDRKVPLVITSLGICRDVIESVHSYNGIVFHDVTNLRHAEKAVAAGVDGLIAISAGAGGHSGLVTPYALVPQLRKRFPDHVLLSGGGIGTGCAVRASQILGADFSYMGTRFIYTSESFAPPEYTQMLAGAKDGPRPSYLPVEYTDQVSGVHANFLRESLQQQQLADDTKAWKNVWSAGHGVINIDEHPVPTTRSLIEQLSAEYNASLWN